MEALSTALLNNAHNELFTNNTHYLTPEKLEKIHENLVKGLEIIGTIPSAKLIEIKVATLYSQVIARGLIDKHLNLLNLLSTALKWFDVKIKCENKVLENAYQLWDERFLKGEQLSDHEKYQLQKFTFLLETFVEIGENYASLKKLTESAARQEFSFNEELIEFLRDCKNIYRNELCHNTLFKFELTETNYALNSCQISWGDLVEHCCKGLQLIKVLNSNSDYTPVSDSSLSLSFV